MSDEQLRRLKEDLRDAEAERDRLQTIVDRAAEAGGNWFARAITAEAERDRLRAVVDAQAASLARLKTFAESEILDRVSVELGADLRAQLDVSPNTGGDP